MVFQLILEVDLLRFHLKQKNWKSLVSILIKSSLKTA
jgi:hypothetical protein